MKNAAMTVEQVVSAGESLGLSVTTAQALSILAYVQNLAKWNSVYNLTAIRGSEAVWTHHVMDCLAVLQPLQRLLPRVGQVLDVGSGGGLPGILLAIMGIGQQVTCIDAVAKKVAFINQMAVSIPSFVTPLKGVHSRVEAWRGSYDLITSRAFAALPDFVAWTEHLLSDGGVWLAMKGKIPHDEMAKLPPHIEVFHVEHLQVPGLDEERCLIWMRQRQ